MHKISYFLDARAYFAVSGSIRLRRTSISPSPAQYAVRDWRFAKCEFANRNFLGAYEENVNSAVLLMTCIKQWQSIRRRKRAYRPARRACLYKPDFPESRSVVFRPLP